MSYCSISGFYTTEPVLLKKSGYIFDKKTIYSFIRKFNKCPITGISSSIVDLIECKTLSVNKPFFKNKLDIISIIEMLEEEIRNFIINYFQLKQNLIITRQELLKSLYQNDSSYKTIIFLIKENNKYKKILNKILAVV
ncbi:splicing factor Prp19 (nucleomorph) [Lotharella oceanica]|uniref:Splicing factor Prp19 n=1 Tax=Lotharella oceanica TaxID=641309 RepID=A0A060DBX6_9EUKA|nr:splicing factor Prp19 [Lotharella oceanica]